MYIGKKLFFITLIFFILLINIFPDVSDDKIINNETGYITGNINIKFSKYWYIDMIYKDKIISGSFDKRVPVNLPKDRIFVEIRIGERRYKGSMYRKTPLFGKNSYEVDILCYDTKFEGEITPYFKKVYKEYKIDCILGNIFYEGKIVYGRKNDEKNISIKYGNNTITGFTALREKQSRIVDYKINDKKVFGTITPVSRTMDDYKIEAQGLTDDELFMFLFLEMFFKIDEKVSEEEKE